MPRHPAARSGVLQLMEVPHNDDSGSDDYSWAEDMDFDAQRRALEEIGRKAKEENKSSSNVNQSSLRETNNHLDKFSTPKDIFGKDKSGKEPGAEQVSVAARAGGSAAEGGGTNTEHDEEIRTPSNDVCVINSKTDGEVAPLIAAMRAFLAFLKKPSNQKTPQHFTVALRGAWGACDGCKQRLWKFAQIWEAEARRYMKLGVRATLVITYKYTNPAETFERKWGSTTYGWAADGDKGSCFHTIEADIIGTNDKV
jgi:hypothetical protein